MIINASKFMPTFKCKKLLANYLIYEKNLPVLDVDDNYWYFCDNELLHEILESLPLWLRLLKNI
jgi:translation elongation factor P/translation initiation factor 5A